MFRLIWRLLLVCLALVILVYGAAFSYYNSEPIALDLLVYELSAFPVGFLLLASLLIGFVLAFLLCSLTISRLRLRIRYLMKKIKTVQSAVTEATIPAQQGKQLVEK